MGKLKYIGQLEEDSELFQTDNKIIIYGYGVNGKRIQEKLSVHKQNYLFCDKNFKELSNKKCEAEIISPEDAINNYPNAEFVVSGKYCIEMFRILSQHNIKSIHMVFV